MDKQDIINFLSEHKALLQARFGVQKIGLFGSYVREQQTPQSDIDIVVELVSDNTFQSFFELKEYLEAAFQAPVDLGVESSLKPVV
ncbi:nucleotidyltransferase family protein, partial [Pseudoponticoccus marisrubri]|uniref:nucleotidyltransferase family protein n=2 Tax=Pseudomonadota TaxID=1224 RepID=UPI0009FFB070